MLAAVIPAGSGYVHVAANPPEAGSSSTYLFQESVVPERSFVASAVTEQVVLNAKGELLLALPADLQTLVSRMLAFQETS